MTLYCGIDLHANNSVVAVLDEADRTIYEKRLPNDLRAIISVLQSYQAVLSGCVVESTYNWYRQAPRLEHLLLVQLTASRLA